MSPAYCRMHHCDNTCVCFFFCLHNDNRKTTYSSACVACCATAILQTQLLTFLSQPFDMTILIRDDNFLSCVVFGKVNNWYDKKQNWTKCNIGSEDNIADLHQKKDSQWQPGGSATLSSQLFSALFSAQRKNWMFSNFPRVDNRAELWVTLRNVVVIVNDRKWIAFLSFVEI